MVRKQKWIAGVTAGTLVSKAARGTLEARLPLVRRLLPQAASSGDRQAKAVHDLRVATRRAMAALTLFEELLPKRRARRLKKRMKQIRRAAGGARNSDVFAERLSPLLPSLGDDGAEAVREHLKQERDAAEKPLRQCNRKLKGRVLDRKTSHLLTKTRWRGVIATEPGQNLVLANNGDSKEPSLAEFARAKFPALVSPLLSADPLAMNVSELHELRVNTKFVRYALEILAPSWESKLCKPVFKDLESLQTHLGEVNDHATAIETLDRWQKLDHSEALTLAAGTLAANEQTELANSHERFNAWWKAFVTSGWRERLNALLWPTTQASESCE